MLEEKANELFRTSNAKENIIISNVRIGIPKGRKSTEFNTISILAKVDHAAEASVFERVSAYYAIGFFGRALVDDRPSRLCTEHSPRPGDGRSRLS